MSVGKTTNISWGSGKQQYRESAKKNLEIILQNKHLLKKVRGGENLIAAAESMSTQVAELTDKQMNFIEKIYEKTFQGAGYDSAPTKHDAKKNLRF